MKVTRTEFKKGVPAKKLYAKSEDFRDLEYDVSPEEAVSLIERLKGSRDHLYLFASENCHVDFYFDDERNLWVEIQDLDFWAISRVPNLDAARAIIEIAHRGQSFDNHVPTTTEEWGAYGNI